MTGNAIFSTGQLASRAGIAVETVRWYEKEGLLPEPPRTEGGQRRYSRRHLDRLVFIRHCRALGFGKDQIVELLALQDNPDEACEAVGDIAEAHLHAVRFRIESLRKLEQALSSMVESCPGGNTDSCRILSVLQDHSLCHHTEHLPEAGGMFAAGEGDLSSLREQRQYAARHPKQNDK